MGLASFNQRVSRAIKRGNVFDKDIPDYAKDAVKTLEDLRSWKHMWTEEQATLAVAADSRTIERLKNCRFIKRINEDGVQVPVKKISPIQIWQQRTNTFPSGFWLSSQTKVQFDSSHSSLTVELIWGYYTYSEYNDESPWFDLSENLLLSQTMLEMAPLLKDDKISARYSPIVAAKLATLQNAEIEAEFDGQDQSMIPYADDMDEYVDGTVDWPV